MVHVQIHVSQQYSTLPRTQNIKSLSRISPKLTTLSFCVAIHGNSGISHRHVHELIHVHVVLLDMEVIAHLRRERPIELLLL